MGEDYDINTLVASKMAEGMATVMESQALQMDYMRGIIATQEMIQRIDDQKQLLDVCETLKVLCDQILVKIDKLSQNETDEDEQIESVDIIIQDDGRVVATLEMPKDSPQEEIEKEAYNASTCITDMVDAKRVAKIVYVPNKLINFISK